jgi:hypothetical protein
MKTRTITHTSISLPGILSGRAGMEASFLPFNFHH